MGTGAPVTATPAGRTSPPKPNSWPGRPSRATRPAGPRTWTTGWTPRPSGRSSGSSSRFRNAFGLGLRPAGGPRAPLLHRPVDDPDGEEPGLDERDREPV